MARLTRWLAVLAAAATLAGVVAAPALAIYPHLNTTLSGPAINGVVPRGVQKLDSCSERGVTS